METTGSVFYKESVVLMIISYEFLSSYELISFFIYLFF